MGVREGLNFAIAKCIFLLCVFNSCFFIFVFRPLTPVVPPFPALRPSCLRVRAHLRPLARAFPRALSAHIYPARGRPSNRAFAAVNSSSVKCPASRNLAKSLKLVSSTLPSARCGTTAAANGHPELDAVAVEVGGEGRGEEGRGGEGREGEGR